MNLSHEEEENFISIYKYESMLKTNKVFFFDSDEFEEIIIHYIQTGRLNLAKKALVLAMEQHPKVIAIHLLEIELLIFDDKLDIAEKKLSAIFAIEPNNEEAFIQKANICSKKSQHKEAIEHLQTALNLTDELADIYSMIGMEYLFLDDLENAKSCFIKCIEEDPDDFGTLYNIVHCYDFLDQTEEAILFLETFIESNPYNEVAWHQLGRQNFILKNYEKAIWAYDYAILIDETFVGSIMEKARALEKIKKYKEAIVCYELTLKLEDPSSYAYLRMGKCYEKLKKKDLALSYYLKVIHEDPLLDKGWIALTDFYLRKDDFNKALYYLNQALEIDEQNPMYWKRFAAINSNLDQYEEAEEGYKKAIECGDIQLETFLLRADILYLLGEFKTAIEVIDYALLHHKNSPDLLYRIAGYCFLIKENEEAKIHLKKALKIDFKNRILLKTMFPEIWEMEELQIFINKQKK